MKKKKKRTNKALENINKNKTKNKFKPKRKWKNRIKKNNIIYSPKKIKRKESKDNSVLKPETNSLSPSIKSKGILELSANIHRNNNIIRNKKWSI